jgi:hypothetical protein
MQAIKTDEELVAQQAIEFWSTICEVELELQRELDDFGKSSVAIHQFVRGSVRFFAPVLLETLLKQVSNVLSFVACVFLTLPVFQDDDPESEDWNAQKASATCLRLVASLVRDEIVQYVMPFVMQVNYFLLLFFFFLKISLVCRTSTILRAGVLVKLLFLRLDAFWTALPPKVSPTLSIKP